MSSCPISNVIAKDNRFVALIEAYKDKHYNNDHLAEALKLCREYHGYNDEWFPETPAQRGVFTRFLNYYLTYAKLSKTESDLTRDSLYNLYSTLYAVYTPEQLDSRISMLAHDFRELLDKIEDSDRTNRTRQQLIEAQARNNSNGYVVLMDKLFKLYESKYTDVDSMMASFDKKYPEATEKQRSDAKKRAEYLAQEYKTVLANKNRLAALAATKIGEDEGFVVNIKNLEVSFEEFNENNLSEPDTSSSMETTGEDREEGSKGERYADYRTLKLINTLSVRAKKLISRIVKVDSNGKLIRDDLGVIQFVGGRQAAVVLKRILTSSSPETMMSDLESASDFYPWIRGLVDALRKNPDYQATVYNNFKNAETTYIYTNLDGGKYLPKIANSRSSGYALMREAGNNLRAGYILDERYSIYTGYGSLKSIDEIERIHKEFEEVKKLVQSDAGTMWIKMVSGDKVPSGKYLNEIIDSASAEGKDVSYLLNGGVDAMSAFLDANPGLTEKIAGLLRGIGFSVSAKDIRTIALQTMSKKSFGFIVGFNRVDTLSRGRNKLYQLVDWMDGVYGRAEQIYKNNLQATGQNLYNTSGAFAQINKCLALAQYKEIEGRVVNEHKSLSAYNHMNLMHQVFDMLSNKSNLSDEEYEAMLEDEYLKYEGMSLGFGERRQASGWLRRLLLNEGGIRDKIKVVDIASFNHVEYASLSRAQKLTNSLIQYFELGDTFEEERFSGYEVPIQSDYDTAYNFVLAPRLDIGNGVNAEDFIDSEIIEALAQEVLMEIERISSIESRLDDDNRIKLSVYEKHGVKFQIFPEFNDNEFRRKYSEKKSVSADEAKRFVKEQVVEQLKNVVKKDIETIEDSKILTNPAMKYVKQGTSKYNMYSESGEISKLAEKSQIKLQEYFINVFYARQQMIKLLDGGLEQFNGLIDFEKRNMLVHATRSSLYTDATWKGKRVGKENQNVVYIEDDTAASAFYDDIVEILEQLKNEDIISSSQFEIMKKAYSNIKTTDGTGLRTLESYRTIQIMSDQWDDRHEDAYINIINGHPSKEDVSVFMQNIKPVFTGYESVQKAEGENQKPVKITVLHKYSEQALLPMALAKYCLQMQSVPFQALENAQSRLKKQGKEIDMFLFHSGVKVGAHSILQPFAKDDNKNRILKSAKEIEDYIVNAVLTKDSVVHSLPFKYYGIAASTPVHVADDKIAWAAQAEKVGWANVQKGDKITVQGMVIDASEGRELYNAIKTANIVENYKKLRELFTDQDELEKLFQEELASKSYSSRELMYALAHLKDGTFAIPLFSSNVEHQVQELLASIIKKRLTKPKAKGANILQATGLGMDIEASSFDNNNALSEHDKLHVVFDGKGDSKRVKYVEVYMPIHDSRLLEFADENGNIGPKRLRWLVDNNYIPSDILEFIAYRTPSDAEHSIIPCRIKGFVANTGGATIVMPKEVMVMTGHDYDGDKMRCHFKNFSVEWNKKLIEDFYNDRLAENNPGDSDIYQLKSFDAFYNWFISEKNQEYDKKSYRHIKYEKYDYEKSVLENSKTARDNARVELLFAQLTSPAGSRRMIIPGGCDETKVIAKSMYIMKMLRDDSFKLKIEKALVDSGMDKSKAESLITNPSSLYSALIKKSDAELTDIVREISSSEAPYSVTHSADAFDYIMGGSQMIGIYALYNSALQMMQRLDMSYIPKVTKKGKQYELILFGKKFDKLFEVRNHRNRLASLGLARLLNAAVDNNKEPVLGYLHQTPETAAMTFLLFAAGITEEEIHLVMNQPAVIELINRLKSRDSKGFLSEAQDIITELGGNISSLDKLTDKDSGQWFGVQNTGKMTREHYISNLSLDYGDIKGSQDLDVIISQISILQTLKHLSSAADDLSTFVRLTRPESESGAIGTTVASIITKVIELNNFRQKLEDADNNDVRISGMYDVLKYRDVHEGWDTSYIEEILGDKLPEVVALNSLMIDSSLEMFRPFFPQAKADWVNLAAEIAETYSYANIQEGIVEKVGAEMILWKLLSNKKFIQGDPQEEQRRILIDVPKQVKDLKQRIEKAKKNPGDDPAADELIGNAFIEKITASSPENSTTAPRLIFSLGGPAIEGTADSIRAYWGAMLNSSDEVIKNLSIDLYKYNLYTNGLTYGMYEFSHFAPFSVLMQTPHFIEALQDVLKSTWTDEERDNFTHQYIMNHWGDKKFLRYYSGQTFSTVKLPDGVKGQIWLSNEQPSDLAKAAVAYLKDSIDKRITYIVLRTGEHGKEQTLYRVERGNSDASLVLIKAQKLGVRSRNNQITLQYNPLMDYHFVKPVVPGNDSAWGQLDIIDPYAQANISSAGNVADDPNYIDSLLSGTIPFGLSFFGLESAAKNITEIEEKSEKAVEKNDEILHDDIPSVSESLSPLSGQMNDVFGLGTVSSNVLQGAVEGISSEDKKEEGKMYSLSIVKRDDDNNITTENVPATPNNIREARKQKVFVELNNKLRDILRRNGIAVGVLTNAEARMAIGGVSDFDTANVTAEGLLEMIRIANGYEGEQALPEEFAHVALEMLGHNHPLVQRLLSVLNSNDEGLQEAFGGMYQEYLDKYGEDNKAKMVVEAAGKLVAKHLFMQEEIKTKSIKGLITRIVDAIKTLLRKFSRDEVQNAIFDANQIASKIAREMLGGRLLDQMSFDNIGSTGQFLHVQKDLTGKQDILSKLLKIETKRLSILKKRIGYANRNKENKAVTATELQISKLESAIRNYKTEDAIVTYMNDSLTFLQATEKSLDDAVNSGRPMNSVCQKLNTVRDTLYSFSKAIQDIRESISEKEIQDSISLTQTIDLVSGVLAKFYDKYNKLARTYFEEMLSNVYGEHGKTVSVGREKGRVISIKEMATKADHDISLVSRWFNSLADCDDYVLKAIDDITRNAKTTARRRASLIRPRIEVAIANLERETGSRDQSFMFETEIGDDGKKHRTGKYISTDSTAYKNLSTAQKNFYNVMMEIKKEADACVPESLLEDRKIIMMRKYTMDRFKDAEGAKGKSLVAWEGLMNRVMDTSDNIDYDNYEVVVDFEGNRVDMLPVRFLLIGENESYDDMSDDVATSMMAYAGMAFEYNELNGIVAMLENARYMSSQRDVVQKTGTRKQRESIGYKSNGEIDPDSPNYYREQFTVKQAYTNIQKALDDFFQMHIYGHIQKNEGTIGRTRLSKRKVVDTVNAITSYSQMAINLPQRIANINTGLTQIIIESVGKGVFSTKDVVWASKIYLKESGDRIAETGKTDYDNKLSLWDEYFDVHQNNGRSDTRYKKGRLSRIFNSSLLYAGLTAGEDYLATTTSLAIAKNFKVKHKVGNKWEIETLWDAYDVKYTDPINKVGAYLSLKDGYVKEDGTPITSEDEKRFAKLVAGMNFELQGIYNLDDRSAVQQYAFGALIIMYRKWIAPAIKRRYAGVSYNLLKDKYQEGYHRTMFRVIGDMINDTKNQVTEDQGAKALLNIVEDMKALKSAVIINWNKLNDYERSNIKRSFTELSIIAGLFLACSLLGKIPPPEYEDDTRGKALKWWDQTIMSQMLRLRTEIGSQAPTPMLVDETMHILKSPFAAIGPLQNTINAFELLIPSNYMTEIKSGRYKGHTRAYKYFRELPVISMFKKVDNFVDPSPLIQYYKNDIVL